MKTGQNSLLAIGFCACLLFIGLRSAGAQPSTTHPSGSYVFSYFLDNGEDGLHLATSIDGYNWKAAGGGKSFLKPLAGEVNPQLMRDPCILLGPDGMFRIVWTDSWNSHSIGYASSKDLIHWSPQKTVMVMKDEPDTLNTWAPEMDYDQKNDRYIIFWSSTVPGRFPETQNSGDGKYNHRVYSTTTKDFETFSPTKLFYDPGFEVIDATILQANNQFYLIVKNETLKPEAAKDLHIATATDINGPYSKASPSITGHWVEGPTAIRVGDDYLVYFDCYRDHHYGAIRSRDLKNWEDITGQITMPPGIRHGTIFAVPQNVMSNLLRASPG